MKKIILAILVVVVVFAFTLPIYADQPDNIGQAIANDNHNGQVRSDSVLWTKDNFDGIAVILGADVEFENFDQVMKWCLNNTFGIPPKHTP